MSAETDIREQVRRRYAASAVGADEGCCGPNSCGPLSADPGTPLYDESDLQEVPANAAAASLGCGNPMAVADLAEGETVLDLGSGGGIDVLLSARRVGPSGYAYGLDMTDEMLDLARRNAAEAGIRKCRVPARLHRRNPPAGRNCRRRHLQLRDQSVR